MMASIIKQLQEQLGWQGIAGGVLLMLAGVFYALTLGPLEQETSFLQERLDEARTKASMQTRTFLLNDQQNELNLFIDSLPSEKDVTDILAKIYALAEKSDVEFKQAEYVLERKGASLLEYKLTFPVQGDYGRVRYFISRVLAENPTMSLDQIRFQRDRVSNPLLKAEILMTVFLRPSFGQ